VDQAIEIHSRSYSGAAWLSALPGDGVVAGALDFVDKSSHFPAQNIEDGQVDMLRFTRTDRIRNRRTRVERVRVVLIERKTGRQQAVRKIILYPGSCPSSARNSTANDRKAVR